MSHAGDDPRCPECGGKIGQRATYCMHCSADLTSELEAADADDDGAWDGASGPSTPTTERSAPDRESAPPSGNADGYENDSAGARHRYDSGTEQLLDPDGLVDNTLTVVVGIVGGIVVGLVGTTVLLILSGSGWAALFGVITWLGATAYLVRRRTVQGAVAHSGYAVALVLLSVPVIALSPAVTVDGGIGERLGLFVSILFVVAVPAGVAAAIGWAAGRFVPEDLGTRNR